MHKILHQLMLRLSCIHPLLGALPLVHPEFGLLHDGAELVKVRLDLFVIFHILAGDEQLDL